MRRSEKKLQTAPAQPRTTRTMTTTDKGEREDVLGIFLFSVFVNPMSGKGGREGACADFLFFFSTYVGSPA